MNRLPLTFECQDNRCGATLDNAPGTTGLLIVSGGNETRAGAFNGQARLAARISAQGFPVFRFDRRGIGDSEGDNRGFLKSGKDIAAAVLAFRALAPQVERIVAFGNCDAATALMLFHDGEIDGLVLSNPWTEDADANLAMAPTAIRARYARNIANRHSLKRFFTGQVNFIRLIKGLMSAARYKSEQSSLTLEMKGALEQFSGNISILLAGNDRTAQIFADRWDRQDGRIKRCENASHSYVEPHAQDWLFKQLLEALRS